jgi:hypothetical protein
MTGARQSYYSGECSAANQQTPLIGAASQIVGGRKNGRLASLRQPYNSHSVILALEPAMYRLRLAIGLLTCASLSACGLGETAAVASAQAKQAQQLQQQSEQLKQQIEQANASNQQRLQQLEQQQQ